MFCGSIKLDTMSNVSRPVPTAATRKKLYGCSVEVTIDVIGGKWKPLILFHLLEAPGGVPLRFSELRRAIGAVTQRSLTLHLRELERDGLLTRRVYAEVPPRVEYGLTPCGHTAVPVLRAMNAWGDIFLKQCVE